MNKEDLARFELETAGVADPIDMPPGEVIPAQPSTSADIPIEDFAVQFLTDDVVGELFGLPASIMARKTEHEWWKLEDEEKCLLGKTCGPGMRYLVQKYLSGSAGPLALAGAGIGIVYGPRWVKEQAERKREEEEKRNPKPTSQSTAQPIPWPTPQPSTDRYAASSGTEGMASQLSKDDFGVLSREL